MKRDPKMRIKMLWTALSAIFVILLVYYTLGKFVVQILEEKQHTRAEEIRLKELRGQCVKIRLAVNRFYDHHGYLPIKLVSDQTLDLDDERCIQMLRVLRNIERSDYPMNEKGRDYLDGVWLVPFVYDEGFRDLVVRKDPWGGSFRIRIDGDKDLEIKVQPKASAKPTLVKGQSALVWSNGPDGVMGVGEPEDDVISWRP